MQPEPRTPDLLAEIARLKAVIEELKTSKPYGLVWEDKPEQFEKDAENAVPVLAAKGGKYKDVELDPGSDHHVLIEGDNYHALSVLSYTHRGKVDVIYIDPPYNTGARDWKYNNDYVDINDNYRHTKWLSLMDKRLRLARDLLKEDGVLIVAIDDNEVHRLRMLIEQLMPKHEITSVTVVHNPRGNITNNFARTHEYALFVLPKGQSVIARTKTDNTSPRKLRRWGHNSKRSARPTMFYPIYVKDGKISRIGEVPDKTFHPLGRNTMEKDGEIAVWPIDQDGEERRWNFGLDSISGEAERLVAIETDGVYDIFLTQEDTTTKTVWTDSELEAGRNGATLVRNITGADFPYPKSIHTVRRCIELVLRDRLEAVALDFFAGSGTTGHAVLELNKDGGSRRVILCTNNENGICEDVTYERMKRVMKGYTAPDGEKVPGLGGNLKYLKTAFVKKELPVGLSDEAKLELTRKANLIIGLRENTFTSIEANDHYEILSSPTKLVGIYFRENKEALTKMLDRMTALAGDKQGFAYVFSWEKGAYKTGFDGYPFTFEDIPEPLVEVYQSIGL